MLRYGTWHSYDIDCQWLSFDALRFVHRVVPVKHHHTVHSRQARAIDSARLGSSCQGRLSDLHV